MNKVAKSMLLFISCIAVILVLEICARVFLCVYAGDKSGVLCGIDKRVVIKKLDGVGHEMRFIQIKKETPSRLRIRYPKKRQTVSVAVFGGSTTAGWSCRGETRSSWPSELEGISQKNNDVAFQVLNFASSGGNSDRSLKILRSLNSQ